MKTQMKKKKSREYFTCTVLCLVTKSKRDHATKHCDDFNKTVTFILDVTKETGYSVAYILAYEMCGRDWTQWIGAL